MVIPKKGKRFGSGPSHQKALMRNLAISLIENERIITTQAKAKYLRGFIDKLINLAKKGDLNSRRRCLGLVGNYRTVQKLFDEIAPKMYHRSSGFTTIIKYKTRAGDGAPLVIMELVK